MEREFDKGYEAGSKDGGERVVRTVYAAVCLALNDLHKFKEKQCMDVLVRAEKYMFEALTDAEAIQEVYDRMGFELNFKEPFERVSFKG